MKPKKKEKREGHSAVVLALLAVTFLAFSNSFTAGFTLDNAGILLKDPRIREATPQNLDLIFEHTYAWPSGETGLYRPFTTLSYLFNYAILGNREQPEGYHWINLILHFGNVVLVYFLARRLVRGFWPSVLSAGLWAVHPVLTESVTNIVGRADLLASMATLSGFLMYLRSTETTGRRRIACLAGLTAVTTLGVFSKETAVSILGVIALYELVWWKERRQGRAVLWRNFAQKGCGAKQFLNCLEVRAAPFALDGTMAALLPILVMLYVRSRVLGASLPAEFPFVDNPIQGANFLIGRLTAMGVMARYLRLMVWPARLSADYSYPEIPLARGSVGDWTAWLVVLAAAVLVVWLYRRNRSAFFLACFAGVTFLPVSNLLFPIGAIMAERFLYLPSVGVVAGMVMAVYAAARRFGLIRFAPAFLGVLILACATRTWSRNLDWQDDVSIAESSLRAAPNSFKLHKQLAFSLYEADPAHSRLDRAIEEAEAALALLDPLPDALNNRDTYRWAGGYYLVKAELARQGAPSDSDRAYQRALQILLRCVAIDKSARAAYDRQLETWRARGNAATVAAGRNDTEPYQLLAAVYLRLDDTDKALQATREALALHPQNPEAYRQIAYAFIGNDRGDEGAVALIEGMLITSNSALTEELMNLYRSGLDTKGCAIAAGPGGPALNPACEVVRKHFCAAAVDVIRAQLQTGLWDPAEKQKQIFERDYGCAAGPLDQLLRSRTSPR